MRSIRFVHVDVFETTDLVKAIRSGNINIE